MIEKTKTRELLVKLLEWTILVVGSVGLIVNFLASENISDAINLISYYTIQSNFIFVILISIRIYLRTHKIQIPKVISLLTMGATLWLLITGLGFIILLSSIYHPEGMKVISNMLLHYINPTLVVLYFFTITIDIKTNKSLSLLFISFPLIYCIIALIRGLIDGFYPYWFLNPELSYPYGVGSIKMFFILLFGVNIIFIIFGYLLVWLHKIINGEKSA